ncbi:phospholipase D-like domain-containing protein [Paenibacillus aurantiacus]|uniref:phospholipase D n=1 Tax=Paenibacillus aurantiacus TaxID=1936118 RepID=A0ABV5KM63_9BACL
MEPITLVIAGVASISLVGYVLIKKRNIHTIEDIEHSNEKEGSSVNSLLTSDKISFALTKTICPPIHKLSDIIDNSERNLDIAMYTFTDHEILTRIIQATKRGVKVRLITDKKQTSSAKGQLPILQELSAAGVPIKINKHNGYMHLKVLITDHKKVVTGSYNYTGAAKKNHDEVIVILEDSEIANRWTEQFNKMWNDNANFRPINYESLSHVS